MGKIKKITENELVGGAQSTDVYPVTSVKAVYDESNERLDNILNRRGVVNISTNYNADHIAEVLTLEQAIAKVPSKDRVLGFQGKFLSENGWKSYVFIGDSIADWTNKTKWNNYLTGTDIVQESGDAEDKVMSQKVVSDKLSDLALKTNKDINLSTANALTTLFNFKDKTPTEVGDGYLMSIDKIAYGSFGEHKIYDVKNSPYIRMKVNSNVATWVAYKFMALDENDNILTVFDGADFKIAEKYYSIILPNDTCKLIASDSGNGTNLQVGTIFDKNSVSKFPISDNEELNSIIKSLYIKKNTNSEFDPSSIKTVALWKKYDGSHYQMSFIDANNNVAFMQNLDYHDETKTFVGKVFADTHVAGSALIDWDKVPIGSTGYNCKLSSNILKEDFQEQRIININERLNERIDNIQSKVVSLDKPLRGIKISWYGTSIPAMGYPQKIGEITGASVTNESYGSSMARRGAKTTNFENDPYKIKGLYWPVPMYGLSMSAEERDNVINNWSDYSDTWVGAYEGEIGAPTNAKPENINDGQHEELKSTLRDLCYDVRLARHLGINHRYNTKEVDVSDIYVIEHAYNDIQPMFNDNGEDFLNLPSDPFDRNNPIGALNFLIKYIYENNPRARILLIGHYECQLWSGKRCKSVIEKVAEYWDIPLCKFYNLSGLSQVKIITNAYWSKIGVWTNSGFSFKANDDDTFETNADLLTFNYHTSANSVMKEYGITEGEGNALWTPTLQQVYLNDNIHPYSEYTKNMFARILSKWIINNY